MSNLLPLNHSESVPIIYTTPHESHVFSAPGIPDLESRIALDELQQESFSDYGTDISVPTNGIVNIRAQRSRGLGDPNRSPDHPLLFAPNDFAQPSNGVWLPGKELTAKEKTVLTALHFADYHAKIESAARASIEKRKTLVVSWHNTSDYSIGTDSNGDDVHMPDIILSNFGAENRPDSDERIVACDPELLEALRDNFEAQLREDDIDVNARINYGYFGGYDTQRYATKRQPKDFSGTHELQALQVEYNTKFTHDQETLEIIPGVMERIKAAFEKAIETTLLDTEIAKLNWRV